MPETAFNPFCDCEIAVFQRRPFITLPQISDLFSLFGTVGCALDTITRLIVEILEHYCAPRSNDRFATGIFPVRKRNRKIRIALPRTLSRGSAPYGGSLKVLSPLASAFLLESEALFALGWRDRCRGRTRIKRAPHGRLVDANSVAMLCLFRGSETHPPI